MNYEYIATAIDKSFFKGVKRGKSKINAMLDKLYLSSLTVHKPWGFEYLLGTEQENAVWILHLEQGKETSLHAHKNKDTILFVLSGEILFGTFQGSFIAFPSDRIFIGRKVFHRMQAVSENTVVMEIETSCNKADSYRLTDIYNRVGKEYENGCRIVAENEK